MNKLFISIILLILLSLNSYSQKSNLERFEVNLISGCTPLEVQIVDENVDSTATVIQYDFNYNNLSFNPSSTAFNIYEKPGKYIIAQANNVDNVEKIDIIEIEVFEPKEFEIRISNCLNDKMEIEIIDNYYTGYNLYIENTFIKELDQGTNNFDYSNYLDSENKFNGLIRAEFYGNDISCYGESFSISSVNSNTKNFIDSVKVSDDRTFYSLFYKPEKSTNYKLKIDERIDSVYLSPSYIYFNDSKIEIPNKTFSDKYVEIEKIYTCQNEVIVDRIFLIYTNAYEESDGIRIDLDYINEYDSLHIYKNSELFSNSKQLNMDSYNLIEGEEYCYYSVGFKNGKKSISNLSCLISSKNYNPLPMPNTFTPNGDGLNDEFKPFEKNVSEYKLTIYNNFGVNIFESNDIGFGWDGNFDGKVIQGSYIYILDFTLNGKKVKQKGKFLLIK